MVYKVLVVGSGGEGKTTFIKRLVNIYKDAEKRTVNEMPVCIVHMGCESYEFWEMNEEPDEKDSSFDTALFLFDYTRLSSFNDAKRAIQRYLEYSGSEYFILIGNKCEADDARQVTLADISEAQMAFNARIEHMSAAEWSDEKIAKFWNYLARRMKNL